MSHHFTIGNVAIGSRCVRAVAGLGLARLPAPTIAADLASGALVPLLGGYTSVPVTLHLVHAGGHLLPARTRALVDFLAERMAGPGRASRKTS